MKRYLSLNKEIQAQNVLNIIGEMINKTMQMDNRVMVIEIKSVSAETIMLPLLEYKGELSK